MLLDEVHQVPLQAPGGGSRIDPNRPREMHRIQNLAIDIELELFRGCISDSNRTRFLVSRQMIQCEFGQPALPPKPYIICICAGSPAMARNSHSIHAEASSVKPDCIKE
jgi:hypothetical protein